MCSSIVYTIAHDEQRSHGRTTAARHGHRGDGSPGEEGRRVGRPESVDERQVPVQMTADGGRCSCPDFELRQKNCKHIFAVEFVVRRERGVDGTVVETRAVRVTYAQDWPAYNQAATQEKEHFCRLLRDLCERCRLPRKVVAVRACRCLTRCSRRASRSTPPSAGAGS